MIPYLETDYRKGLVFSLPDAQSLLSILSRATPVEYADTEAGPRLTPSQNEVKFRMLPNEAATAPIEVAGIEAGKEAA